MDADFVAFGDDTLLFLGMQQRCHGRHVEAGLHAVPVEQFQDTRSSLRQRRILMLIVAEF
jgi:hypothetical protein